MFEYIKRINPLRPAIQYSMVQLKLKTVCPKKITFQCSNCHKVLHKRHSSYKLLITLSSHNQHSLQFIFIKKVTFASFSCTVDRNSCTYLLLQLLSRLFEQIFTKHTQKKSISTIKTHNLS